MHVYEVVLDDRKKLKKFKQKNAGSAFFHLKAK